jgi:hypothetical protein
MTRNCLPGKSQHFACGLRADATQRNRLVLLVFKFDLESTCRQAAGAAVAVAAQRVRSDVDIKYRIETLGYHKHPSCICFIDNP